MPHNPGESRQDNPAVVGLRLQSPLAVLVAFAVSMILHIAVVLVLTIWGIRGCGDGSMLAIEGESRLVGIYVKQPESNVDKTDRETESAESQSQVHNSSNSLSASPDLSVSDEPPVEVKLPDSVTKRLGPGGAPPSYSSSDMGDVVMPKSGSPAFHPLSGLGPGEVSFFNTRDTGTKIVFVIDTSSSMYESLRDAKAELSASIQSLQPTQLFQVVFYDNSARALNIRGPKQGDLYRAGDFVKTLAQQEIARVSAQGGTNHKVALAKALKMNPEIMFLLTDAETVLQPRQLNDILRLNNNGVRIHCIEFGEGSYLPSSGVNFLKKLAAESGGKWRYVNVKNF